MSTAKAQAAQVLIAREATPGTTPTTGWMKLEPNPSGIQNFHPDNAYLARNVLSPYMTDEKGDIVGLTAAPTIVHDLNIGWLDILGPSLVRSQPKVPGNQGVQIYYPTAVTGTGFTVTADGDLPDGTLIQVEGCSTASNNGVKKLAGTSTTVLMKAAGLMAESLTQGTVKAKVCGFEGAADDIELDANGDLISTTLDFTTLNLKDWHLIAFEGSANGGFGTFTGRQYAFVKGTVTAHKIPLRARSFAVGADDGSGKSIRLYFGTMFRNVADGDPDYIEPFYSAELRDTGVGIADAEVYSYANGLVASNFSIALGVQSKIEVTTAFMGFAIDAPLDAADRLSGPSTAYPLVASNIFNTSSELWVHRIVNASDDSLLVAECNSCTLTIAHNVKPRNQLATFGAAGMIFGKIRPAFEADTYFERAAVPRAISNNTSCRYEAIAQNGQGGVSFVIPGVVLTGGAKTYAEDSPVMMALGSAAHRDPASNVVMVVNVLPYIPAE